MNVHEESSECDQLECVIFSERSVSALNYLAIARHPWKHINKVMKTPDIPSDAGGESFFNAHGGHSRSDRNAFGATE